MKIRGKGAETWKLAWCVIKHEVEGTCCKIHRLGKYAAIVVKSGPVLLLLLSKILEICWVLVFSTFSQTAFNFYVKISWSFDRLIKQLIDWSSDWLIEWLSVPLTMRLSGSNENILQHIQHISNKILTSYSSYHSCYLEFNMIRQDSAYMFRFVYLAIKYLLGKLQMASIAKLAFECKLVITVFVCIWCLS